MEENGTLEEEEAGPRVRFQASWLLTLITEKKNKINLSRAH